MGVSKDHIRWAYRLFLDREPESEEAVDSHDGMCGSTKELRQQFLSSEEYSIISNDSLAFEYFGQKYPMNLQASCSERQMKLLLDHVQKTWEKLGSDDAHWSVVARENFKSDSIDGSLDDFFESGGYDFGVLRATLKRNGFDIQEFGTCLELGCGVGRMTSYLAKEFKSVVACDVSRFHLEFAEKHLTARLFENIEFLLIEGLESISQAAQVDFVYSIIVLQHNPPPIIEKLIGALLSKLNSGGVAFLQVPTYKENYVFKVDEYLSDLNSDQGMEMHCLPQKRIFEIALDHDCIPIEVIEDLCTGRPKGELSNTFLLQKR